jgi:transglutaminase-like putative cysteine protease
VATQVIADAAATCRLTGLSGWDLVDFATRLVSARFSTYSVLHPWDSPAVALQRGRGFCIQYNGALALLLRTLGFRATLVYARRVRFDDQPAWRLGHTWARVEWENDVKDVCARSTHNAPGLVHFSPVGRVRAAGRVALFVGTLGSYGAAVSAIGGARLRGEARPRWVEHPRTPT